MPKTIKELLDAAIQARGRVAVTVKAKAELRRIEGEETALVGEGISEITQEESENLTIRQT